jgi:hypothetical protein
MSEQDTPSERGREEDDDDIEEQEDEDEDEDDACGITKLCNKLNMNVDASYADVHRWLERKMFEDTAVRVLHPEGGCGLPHKAVITLFVSTHQDDYIL